MKAIEIFPCSGGMAEGFRRAGITFEWAFDHSAEACDSYEANLGHRPVRMDARDLLRLAQSGWRPTEELDLMVADPPCTPWSRAGKRLGVEDERDMLGVTCELILLLRPRAYLIGNVPGLDDSTQWHHLQAALKPLGKAGYCIREYVSLDAADFGVPQHRVRPWWFGHLAGPHIRWPLPTHGPPSSNVCLPGTDTKPWVTCRDALGHLPIEQLGRPVRLKKFRQDDCGHPSSEMEKPAHGMPASMTGNGGRTLKMLAAPRPHHHTNPDRPARTQTASRQDDSRLLNWPWDVPSTTIARDDRIPPPGHHDEYSILSHPNAVVLSELAAKILQGFPESWKLLAPTKTGRWSMLGQAMPPALAEAVARRVAEQLAATTKREARSA